jgi:hypothetical protein
MLETCPERLLGEVDVTALWILESTVPTLPVDERAVVIVPSEASMLVRALPTLPEEESVFCMLVTSVWMVERAPLVVDVDRSFSIVVSEPSMLVRAPPTLPDGDNVEVILLSELCIEARVVVRPLRLPM